MKFKDPAHLYKDEDPVNWIKRLKVPVPEPGRRMFPFHETLRVGYYCRQNEGKTPEDPDYFHGEVYLRLVPVNGRKAEHILVGSHELDAQQTSDFRDEAVALATDEERVMQMLDQYYREQAEAHLGE